jgi:pimeloyl-ACP methyl ester carboxylesterase
MSVPPPGRLVDVGGFRLHLDARGAAGGPTVVFEAALGGSSISWTLVQDEVARFARACSYDRAGFGWSDAGPKPRTAGRIADELGVLLERSGEPPPYVIVGHSFGGLVARVFAGRYRDRTAGLVLVDPARPEDWRDPGLANQARVDRGVRLCRQGALAARLGVARVVATLVDLGALGPARALARFMSRGGVGARDEQILAPMWKLPPGARRPLRQFWTRAAFFEALGSQIGSIATSAGETLAAAPDGYDDLPLITISASNPTDHERRAQEAVLGLSTRARHLVATDSGHWIPLDEPETVIDAVRRILAVAVASDRQNPR